MQADALLTIAEIAGTFAGLVALASLFQPGERNAASLYGIIEAGIIAAAFALLPVIFSETDRLTDAVLRPCAVVFLITWTLSAIEGYRMERETTARTADIPREWGLVVPVALAYLPGFCFPIVLLSPLLAEHSAVLYTASVVCPLAVAVIILRNLVQKIFVRGAS